MTLRLTPLSEELIPFLFPFRQHPVGLPSLSSNPLCNVEISSVRDECCQLSGQKIYLLFLKRAQGKQEVKQHFLTL